MRRLLLLLLTAVLATETVAIAVHAPRSVATSDSPVLSTNGTVVWWYLATKSYTYPPNHLVYSNTLLFFENADTPPSLKFVELKTGQVFRTVPLNASYSVLDASSDLLIIGGEEGLLALSWSGKVLWRTIWSVKGVEVGNSSLVVWNEAELLFLDRETGSILYTTPFEWGIPLFAVSRGDVLYTVERNTTSDSVAVCAYRLPNLTLITESSPLTEVSLTPVVVRICFLSGDRMVVGIRGFCVAGLDVNTLAIAYEVEEVVDFTVVDDHDADGVKDLCVIMQQGLYLLSGETGGFLAWVSEESYVWVERVGHDANEDGVEDVCCAFSSEEGEVVGFISVKQESRMIGWMRLKLGLLTITRVNDVNGDRRADLLLSTVYGYVLLLSVTDFHPPLVEIVAPENESVVKSPIVVKAVLWDFESGVASATCFLDGVAHQMSVNESIGGSTAQLCLDAGEGWHTLYIEVEDFAGNRQTTPFFRILVDNTPPMISIVSPPNQTILANTTLDICWTVYDDVSGVNAQQVVVQPLGYEVQLPPSTHNLTLQVPQDGVVTVILTAYDHAGNAGSTTCTVIVDAQPPQVRIEQPMNGSFISETAIEIGWSCEDTGSGISSVVVRVDNRIVYEGNETMNTILIRELKEGFHTVEVTAIDRANHERRSHVVFGLDITPPTLRILRPTNGEEVAGDVVIVEWEGVDDFSGISEYRIQVNGLGWQSVGLNTSAEVELLPWGETTIEVEAIDRAGNVATCSVQVRCAAGVETGRGSKLLLLTVVLVGVLAVAAVARRISSRWSSRNKRKQLLSWLQT